jgi:hypothetical protein
MNNKKLYIVRYTTLSILYLLTFYVIHYCNLSFAFWLYLLTSLNFFKHVYLDIRIKRWNDIDGMVTLFISIFQVSLSVAILIKMVIG